MSLFLLFLTAITITPPRKREKPRCTHRGLSSSPKTLGGVPKKAAQKTKKAVNRPRQRYT